MVQGSGTWARALVDVGSVADNTIARIPPRGVRGFCKLLPSSHLLPRQIVSLLNGEKLVGGGETAADTINALGTVNGRQLLAGADQVAMLKEHIRSYQARPEDRADLLPRIRQIEQLMLHKHAGYLIGNQCVDFQKQDGTTEIEEAIMANTVERRLNDLLLMEEKEGRLLVNRQPIYVSTVSNFTNFLDLSRKALRSLEVGIPVVILGRRQTSQHSYRWTQLLVDLCCDAGVDPGMITFLSCSLDDIKDITESCQASTGNLYTTCSRSMAAEIKASYPKTIASTGGPNTLVCLDWDSETANHAAVVDAIARSAAIESAGQCTALRHCVVPASMADDDCLRVFDNVLHLDSAESAIQNATFAGVFANHKATAEPPHGSDTEAGSYQRHDTVDAFVKIRHDDLPTPGMEEFWRKVVVDFTKMDLQTVNPVNGQRRADDRQLNRLVAWLNKNQPISLAINGPRQEALVLGLKLWERTALVVNTIGSSDDPNMPPAMTCQARPQDAECFGEFPPRSSMSTFTTFPVVVPSSNPSYDAVYSAEYLNSRASPLSEYMLKSTRALLDAVREDAVRGYCVLLIEYLQNATRSNPKEGADTSRTVLWGIQRPPLGTTSVIRCGRDCTWDSVAPIYVIFHATSARDHAELSIDPDNIDLVTLCSTRKLPHVVETEAEFAQRCASRDDVFHSVRASDEETRAGFPMVGNFVSLYLPFGHVKSTMAKDEEFAFRARMTDKWLITLF